MLCCALPPVCLLVLALLLLVLMIPIAAETVAWTRLSRCHTQEQNGTPVWGSIIPATTMSQKPIKFSQLFYHEVDVFDNSKANTPQIGYWTNVDIILGIFQMYAYTDTSAGSERVLLQARKPPFRIYFGKRYELNLCNEQGRKFLIQEDYWNEPWFQLVSPQLILNISDADTQQVIAVAQYNMTDRWSLFNSSWSGVITAPDGTLLATLQQENLATSGWFANPRWYTQNLQPEILPNEVVSFLSAVYDIDRSRSAARSGSSSSRRRR